MVKSWSETVIHRAPPEALRSWYAHTEQRCEIGGAAADPSGPLLAQVRHRRQKEDHPRRQRVERSRANLRPKRGSIGIAGRQEGVDRRIAKLPTYERRGGGI